MTNLKKLPIGIDDFKHLIQNDYYFVDKSLFIEELLFKKMAVTLLPRPRRFGKTLNMSMLSYFFTLENHQENRKLFEQLAIAKTDSMQYQGCYPVIHLSFKDIKVNDWKLCLEKTSQLLQMEAEKHQFEFSGMRSDQESFLLELSKFLYQKHNKKVVILIDEYDTPLITAHARGYYQEAIDFFRNFLSAGLKSNPYLEFSVLTGILRIAKESVFSGLNNLFVSTILDEEYNHFGLTEPEVEQLLSDYELTPHLTEVKRWYNGYRFGTAQVYNPWSLINFASRKKLEPYWVNTSDNALIKQLLKHQEQAVFEDLETLFEGHCIEKSLSETIVFSDLAKTSALWSLLFFSGYLTFESINISAITSLKTHTLKIPNQEIKSFFRESFIEDYTNGKVEIYSQMIEALFLGKIPTFSHLFKTLYQSSISYHDSADNEKYYHHFMLGLLLTLGDKYVITSNRESGLGRYDIALEPIDKSHYGLIFEFKVAPANENLSEMATQALQQINDKQYDAAMKQRDVHKIIKIGMAFCGKQVEIASEMI